ncbi:hypothetical protein [Komagataeibacter sp. FNDCR2]|uniref:hypothetical protein n=1 Tax=Komagataeibacter sp. FNDCR2 TaxID=2878682 RepID=UPI001E387A16|nr:hypothetical protein [Komagataeibacter sp. FNDCR2]MCE2575931.1 hypothetical protein [Komagataeibacter sp. FNDCR2]
MHAFPYIFSTPRALARTGATFMIGRMRARPPQNMTCAQIGAGYTVTPSDHAGAADVAAHNEQDRRQEA